VLRMMLSPGATDSRLRAAGIPESDWTPRSQTS
jgi:hypothetical protein